MVIPLPQKSFHCSLARRGLQAPPTVASGHDNSGAGSLRGFRKEHHDYLYALHKNINAIACGRTKNKVGITVISELVLRWFATAVKYQGSLRVTDIRAVKRDTYENSCKLKKIPLLHYNTICGEGCVRKSN